MFNNPYETTACSGHPMQPTISALKQAYVTGELQPAKTLNGKVLQGIYTIPSYLKTIAPFYHPLPFEHQGQRIIVIDTRAYLRTAMNGDQVITQPTDYSFLLTRAALVAVWMNDGGPRDLLMIADLPARVLCDWLSKAMVRSFGLDPLMQQSITAITGYFFFCQFSDAVEHSEREKILIAGRLSRLTRVSVEEILRLIGPLKALKNMFDYVDAIKSQVPSSRLESLNPGILLHRIGGAWFGAAANEVAAIAIEYPPYLLAMVNTAVGDQSYRKTRLAETVQIYDRNSAGSDFSQQVSQLIISNLQ